MDARRAWTAKGELRLRGETYRVEGCAARGSGALLYRASRLSARGEEPALLREAFPWHPDGLIRRGADGAVRAAAEAQELLASSRARFLRSESLWAAQAMPVCGAHGALWQAAPGRGEPLAARAGEPLSALLPRLLRLLAAVESFHARGLLLLDLSPRSVWLLHGPHGETVCAGWNGGFLPGEPLPPISGPFAAPELLLGDAASVGPAADLYAVCALLAWALGCLPAAGLSPERGPCRLSPGSLAACPALRGASPAAVRQAGRVLCRGLKTPPGRRFSSAREAMEEFARLLELAADDLRGPDASWTGRQTGVLC